MPYAIEVTDTFGGESNYTWVKRKTVPDCTKRELFKHLRELAGWPTTIRLTTTAYGDGYEIRPSGLLQIAFINYVETPPDEVTPETWPTLLCTSPGKE